MKDLFVQLRKVEKKTKTFVNILTMAFRIIRQRKEARRNAKLEEIFEVNKEQELKFKVC